MSDGSSDVCSSDLWWEGRDGEVLVSEINRASDGGGTFAGCRVGRCRDCRNARSRSWVERLRRSGNPHSLRARSSLRLHITSQRTRTEEHTSELQSLMRNSYAVFCFKNKYQTTYY